MLKGDAYTDFSKYVNDIDPKLKVGDHVRSSKYKKIFAERYTPNWSEEVHVIKEVKNTVPWTYVINDLNGEEIVGKCYEKKLQKTNQQEFRIENKNQEKKEINYMSNEKAMIVHLIARLIKKDLIK